LRFGDVLAPQWEGARGIVVTVEAEAFADV
jgi:hypothetical protein